MQKWQHVPSGESPRSPFLSHRKMNSWRWSMHQLPYRKVSPNTKLTHSGFSSFSTLSTQLACWHQLNPSHTCIYSKEASAFSNISVQLLVSSSQVKLRTRQRVHLTQITPLQLAVPLPVPWTARGESATVFPFISLLSYKITKSWNLLINPLLAPGHP